MRSSNSTRALVPLNSDCKQDYMILLSNISQKEGLLKATDTRG